MTPARDKVLSDRMAANPYDPKRVKHWGNVVHAITREYRRDPSSSAAIRDPKPTSTGTWARAMAKVQKIQIRMKEGV